jgi:hypothetical protein
MMKKQIVDPEPFSIVISAAALVSGVDAAMRIYSQLFGTSSVQTYDAVQSAMDELDDVLRYVGQDVAILREVMAEASFPIDRKFRPGRRAFLSYEQFRRYERATNNLISRLARVVLLMNRVDRLLSAFPQMAIADAAEISEVQKEADRLISDRDQTIDQAFDRLSSVMAGTHRVLTSVRELIRPK